MLKELLKEEEAVKTDFQLFIESEAKIEGIEEIKEIDTLPYSKFKEILEIVVKQTELALKECQIIESLDKQLKLISDTQNTLNNLKKLNQLGNSILNSENENENLSKIVPLALEWQNYGNSEVLNLSESSEIVKIFINEKLPKMVNEEIEKVLLSWTDDINARDQQSIDILYLRIDSGNPLDGLFASYPLSKLNSLLEYHKQLRTTKLSQYPERLLNRFYDILQEEKGTSTIPPFSVGQIEVLISERMKFATRISCILEATFNFVKLHPDLKETFMEKCGQICKQIRKCAKEERGYDNMEGSNAAILDSQLNEISLIITTLKASETKDENMEISKELNKWMEIYSKLEEIYLIKGIQQAIEIDQITTTEEFPVSSCVDDIFYVLQAAKGRIDKIHPNSSLIQTSLREFFLNVLKKYLETSIKNLKSLNLFELKIFAPSRELITSLILVNNLIATRNNWRRVNKVSTVAMPVTVATTADATADATADSTVATTADATADATADLVQEDIKNILIYALNNGIYSKVLQSSIKKELIMTTGGDELFIKIHSLLTIINNLFKTTMAKEALDELISLSLSDFSQIFCKQLYDYQSTSSSNSSLILKYDRLLHELTNWLEESLSFSNISDPSLLRLKQSISILLAESKKEAQDLVEEWKNENNCTLRAGEILLIMNKLK